VAENYNIRCKICGFIRKAFHGWAFMGRTCPRPNQPGMHHDWEVVE